jgi:prepilin peptidase CpaA
MCLQPVNLALCLFLLPSTFFDLKHRRIPNWLTLPAILTGLALHVLLSGRDGFFFSATGLAIGIGLLILPFAMGGMGAGDVKLLGAIGSFVGPVMTLRIFLVSAVLGLAASLVLILAVSRHRKAWLSRIRGRPAGRKGEAGPARDDPTIPRVYLPYGAVLAAGTLLSFILFP